MNFSDAELAALEADTVSLGVFFRLATDPVVRMWLGFGEIQPGVNALDETGASYLGFGEIKDIPTFRQLLNGAAERVDFTMSGVSGTVLDLAADDAEQVRGKACAVGFALMAADWSLIDSVHWLAHYTADVLSLTQALTDDPEKPIQRTLALSCGTRFTARRRPSLSYFTNADQQLRHPGDTFCGFVGLYANQLSIAWPIY